MSDTAKNKKKAHDWEEAGAEFYQENYNADWDGLPKNSLALKTFLPSKVNRSGTYKTQSRHADSKKYKYCQPINTTTQKENDFQFSMLPDLSQVMTDEERIWEEVLQIKLLPVPMQQKKNLKLHLQSATKLRLQGFNQFKWKHRKIKQKVGLKWTNLVTKLKLWQSSLKKIEGHFGTGVVAYFLFLRWLLFLNLSVFILILTFLIFPKIILNKNEAAQCNNSLTNNASITLEKIADKNLEETVCSLNIFQNECSFKNSLLFYGAYESNKNKSETHENCSQSEHILSTHYDLTLAYIFVAIVYLFITLVAIVKASAREFKDRLINGKWQFYQYCNVVFSGWDFCIHSEKCAIIKQKALLNEIKGLLQSKRIELDRNNRSNNFMLRLITTRILINIGILIILLLSAYLIYFLLKLSLDTSNAPEANSNKLVSLFFEFIPYIAIVCLNLFLPTVFNYLCKFEQFSPSFVVKISLLRTVFLRLSSLAIILSRFYNTVIPSPNRDPPTEFSCWETFVGAQFYKLIITDFISQFLVTFVINFPRALCARSIEIGFIKFIGEQEFDLPKHVLDIVYSQTICWLGSFYAPFLPGILAVFIICMFYIKKFQCLVNSKPSELLYGSSRSNALFMLILLLSYFMSIIPITFAFSEVTPSATCGPFKGLKSVWDVPISAFMSMPEIVKNGIFFFGTARFAIPCFIVLILLLYYFHAISDANKNMVRVLKHQLILEGHDKQFLLNRLSIFLKPKDATEY